MANQNTEDTTPDRTTLERRERTIVFRLRNGHFGLKKTTQINIKRMGSERQPSVTVAVKNKQTPEHILRFCPHYEEARQEAWPQDTPPLHTKLSGATPTTSEERQALRPHLE